MWRSTRRLSTALPRVVVFPGQGVFDVGKLNYLKKRLDWRAVRDVLEEADEAVGYKLSDLITNPVGLQRTSVQQPMLLTTTKLTTAILQEEHGLDLLDGADYLLGHSLGEIIALVMQGTISFSDGVRFCAERGKLMEKCVAAYLDVIPRDPQDFFKMFALVFSPKAFDQVLATLEGSSVSISNINSRQQVVISGLESDCLVAVSRLKENVRVKAIDLEVSVPFHSKVLDPVRGGLDQMLKHYIGAPLPRGSVGFRPGQLSIPMVSNLDGSIQTYAEDQVRNIVEVTSRPVQFLRCLETIGDAEYLNLSSVTKGIISKVHRGYNVALDSELDSFIERSG